ncbi:hypothetical protein [Okeania sp. SIO2B3]|nr:hypothetical protein [Okeania sp. SIO2B3]NET42193.1 hypothetical protein [Okeania sp. SIO2B3]
MPRKYFYFDKQEFPLAVVKHKKKEFQVMVEAVDVLTSLGQPNQNLD